MFRSLIKSTATATATATTTPPLVEDGNANLEESSQQEDNLSFLTDPMGRSEIQDSSTSQTTTNHHSCSGTIDHSRIKAYRENVSSNSLALALDSSKSSAASVVPTKKMVNIHDIMISDGSLTYDNIHIMDPEEQQQAARADFQHLEQVAQTTSTLEDVEESLGYLVEALDLEEHEMLKGQASPAPPADSSLSFHASEMTTSSEELELGLGDSISTTMSADELIVVQESPWTTPQPEAATFNEPVMDDVTSLPAEQQHGLDVLMNVGNQLLLEDTETAPPTATPMHARRSNIKSWAWIFASLLLVVVLGISIIFAGSFQSKSVVVHQDVPPTQWQAINKKNNSSLFIPMDAPKENETKFDVFKLESTTNSKEQQIDQEIVQDESNSGSSSWITAAFGFLVMWMAIPKRSNSVVVTDDVSEQEANAGHNAESTTTKNNDDQVKEEETTSVPWDFSAYEKLRVADLRQRLESRCCSTVGRKHDLIQRLVDVYSSELETLTVVQLRPVLKSKGCKQAGRKQELIQRLVEAGI